MLHILLLWTEPKQTNFIITPLSQSTISGKLEMAVSKWLWRVGKWLVAVMIWVAKWLSGKMNDNRAGDIPLPQITTPPKKKQKKLTKAPHGRGWGWISKLMWLPDLWAVCCGNWARAMFCLVIQLSSCCMDIQMDGRTHRDRHRQRQ